MEWMVGMLVGGVAGVLIYGCMNDSLRTAAAKATTA